MEISHRNKKKRVVAATLFYALITPLPIEPLANDMLITLAMIEATMEIITSTGIHLLPVVRRLSDNVYIVTQ